jgi:Fe-S cluster assembly iron-binding protein IscA
LSILDKKWDNT